MHGRIIFEKRPEMISSRQFVIVCAVFGESILTYCTYLVAFVATNVEFSQNDEWGTLRLESDGELKDVVSNRQFRLTI